MRLYQIGLLAVGILLGRAALAAEQPSVGDITKELTGEKPATERAPEQLAAVYAQVLDVLLPDMGSEDPGKRGAAQGTIERIAFRTGLPGMEADRAACSKAIAAKLGTDAGPLARVWLLRQLERIGCAEAVPQVARLLTDKDAVVRDAARRALRKNCSKEANAALQDAIGLADLPAWRAALINALAERRDPANLEILTKEAAATNDDIRTAAVIGLAKLGDKSAVAPIAAAMQIGSTRTKRIATDCYLRLADALAAKGDKTTALGIYKNMLGAGGHIKCAALIGIGRAGSASDLPTLFDALADPDVRARGACVEAMCLLEGNDVTAAIAAKAQAATTAAKPALLQALALRGDKSTVSIFLTAADDADEAVEAAALAGLGALGHPGAVPVLLKAAVAAGKAQEAARQSLQCLPGADIDKAVLDAIGQQDPKIRAEVIRALAARHVVAATPALLKAAEDADSDVRNESLKALGIVAPTSALPALTAVLIKTEDAASRGEAASSLVLVANRDPDIENRCDPMLKALGTCSGPAKFALLSVLGRVGGPKSLEGVCAAVKDGDEKVKEAALRALTEWPDAEAAQALLAIAKTAATPSHQILAVRGYIRVCRIRANRPDAETAKLLIAGLEAAKRPEEKRQALGGLAEARDILALQAVVPCMDDPALREEAASAAARIGRDLWQRHPAAVKAAVEKVLEVSKNDNLKQEAKKALDQAEQRLKEIKPKK